MQHIEATLNVSVIDDILAQASKLREDESCINSLYNLSEQFRSALAFDVPIYLTGIGKPGYVAMKQAATLKSIAVQAEFIDATLAGHGDLGSIPTNKASMLFAMSKSGLSSELYKLFTVLKQIRPQCQITLICMSTNEQLEQVNEQGKGIIDNVIRFNVEPGELEGRGIVPATSNALFEVICSTAIANAATKAFGVIGVCERLQICHPSGTLQNKVTKLLNDISNEQ